jgi:hypothetical protein
MAMFVARERAGVRLGEIGQRVGDLEYPRGFFRHPVVETSPQRRQITLPAIPAGLSFIIFLGTTPRG